MTIATINDVRSYQDRAEHLAVTAAQAHGLSVDDMVALRTLAHGPHPPPLGGDGQGDALILANEYTICSAFSVDRRIHAGALPPQGLMTYGGSAPAVCFLRWQELGFSGMPEQHMAFFLYLAGGAHAATRGAVTSLLEQVKEYYRTRPIGPFTSQQGWWVEQYYSQELGVQLRELVSFPETNLGAG